MWVCGCVSVWGNIYIYMFNVFSFFEIFFCSFIFIFLIISKLKKKLLFGVNNKVVGLDSLDMRDGNLG